MASGVEIAGLALAIFPLVVGAIDRWATGVEKIKEWRKYRRRLERYASKLECEGIFFRNSLEMLLDGIPASEEDVAALLNSPGSDLWRSDPEYDSRLKQRLEESYTMYLRAIRNLESELNDFKTLIDKFLKLSVVETKGIHSSRSIIDRGYQRLKFSFSKTEYDELLQQINPSNRMIFNLTEGCLRLEPIRQKRRSTTSRPILDFAHIRHQAQSLYNVCIKRSWKCKCQGQHVANLHLEPRPGPGLLERGERDTRFCILLWNEPQPAALICAWKSRRIEIELIEPPHKPNTKLSMPQQEKEPPQVTPRKKAVRFADVLSATYKLALLPLRSSISMPTNDVPITNWCQALNQTKNDIKECLGVLTDDQRVYRVYSSTKVLLRGSISQNRLLTLSGALGRSQARLSKGSMGVRDRYYLALTIASSILQLDGTEWLHNDLQNCDIFLACQGASEVDYQNPFISKRIGSGRKASLNNGIELESYRLIKSHILYNLGVSLVELGLGRSIISLQESEDIVEKIPSLTELQTVRRLMHDEIILAQTGDRFNDVIRCCIDCPFKIHDKDMKLDNEDFQKEVYSNIVAPLMDELSDFDGKNRIR
ncbi:MAG: hypothetical protein M1834_006731 [Cirrosporium novae-zelandiae]|nr:MAG: hypothetical protein M1834_006731 [Cirrosporium novae-zelandiae]